MRPEGLRFVTLGADAGFIVQAATDGSTVGITLSTDNGVATAWLPPGKLTEFVRAIYDVVDVCAWREP